MEYRKNSVEGSFPHAGEQLQLSVRRFLHRHVREHGTGPSHFTRYHSDLLRADPEAVSHETKQMNRYEILKATFDLKIEIYKRTDEIIENFLEKHAQKVMAYHPKFTARFCEDMIRENLKTLLKAFF